MSSTNRNAVRNDADYYRTPAWAIEEFLAGFIKDNPGFRFGRTLDPCAGGTVDAEGRPVHEPAYPSVLLGSRLVLPAQLTSLDLRTDAPVDRPGRDFLEYRPHTLYDTIISNPPFNLAHAFVEHSLSMLEHRGTLVFLLRLNFLGSLQRAELWRRKMPTWIYVHSRRMKFSDAKSTDSVEYAHFVWTKDDYPSAAKLRVLSPQEGK